MATKGIIENSIINYQVTFQVPAQTTVTGILIRDTLPAGLTYTTDPGVSWSTGGKDNLTVDYIPYTAETEDADEVKSLLQISITHESIVKNTDDDSKEYTINIPVKVKDSTKLVLSPEKEIENKFELYSSVITPVNVPTVNDTVDQTEWTSGTDEEGHSSTSNLFIDYKLIVKGDLIEVENTTPQDLKSGYDFNVLNTIAPSTDLDSTFSYLLTIDLDENFAEAAKHLETVADNVTAQNGTEVYYLNGEERVLVTDEFTVTRVSASRYTVTMPYKSDWKTRVLHVYVPFKFTTPLDFSEATTNSIILRNPIKVELKDGNDKAVLTTISYADVKVAKPVVIPHVSFGGKTLN